MDKKSIVRWAFGLIGLAKAAIWIREMLVRPDRDVLIDMIGSVVSIHSLYLGGAIFGVGIVIVSAIPVIQWIFKWPERRRAREGAARQAEVDAFRRNVGRVEYVRNLAVRSLQDADLGVPGEVFAEIADIKIRLGMLGIPTPDDRASDDEEKLLGVWTEYLVALMPLAEMGEIEKARSITISDGSVCLRLEKYDDC